MDEKVRDRVNVLNSLQYTTRKKEERLKELETQQQKKNGDSSDSNANGANESEDAQVFTRCLSSKTEEEYYLL